MDQTFEETGRKNNNEDREIAENGDQLLPEKKNTEETEENGRQNLAQREKTKRAKESHDRSSQPLGMCVLKTADLGTLALLVVNSFKLHLTAWRENVEKLWTIVDNSSVQACGSFLVTTCRYFSVSDFFAKARCNHFPFIEV